MAPYILILLCIAFFSLAHFFSAASLFARIAGKLTQKPFLSQSLEKISQLVSIIFLTLFAPILGYITESVFSTKNYLLMVTLAQAGVCILLGLLYLLRFQILSWLDSAITLSQTSKHVWLTILRYARVSPSRKSGLEGVLVVNKSKYFWVGFFLNLFLASGFFIAFYFASLIPDYRLTLSQLYMLIHGFGTLIQAFYADPALGRSLDNTNKEEWWPCFLSYYKGRWFAHLFLACVFFASYFWTD
ncbi:hypothetical protein AOB54_01490 [beta proteobacterium MWH-UniP1]